MYIRSMFIQNNHPLWFLSFSQKLDILSETNFSFIIFNRMFSTFLGISFIWIPWYVKVWIHSETMFNLNTDRFFTPVSMSCGLVTAVVSNLQTFRFQVWKILTGLFTPTCMNSPTRDGRSYLFIIWRGFCDVMRDLTSEKPSHIKYIHVPSPVNSLMAVEGWFVVEFFPTFGTFIWLLSWVSSVMYSEVWHPREGFPTFVTFKRFLSWMNSMMYSEIRHLREEFATFVTLIGFLSCVCPLVSVKGWILAEGFPTFVTFVGLLSWMNSVMYREVWHLREELPTYVTFIGLLSFMYPPVSTKSRILVEGLPTFITFVGLHSWVSSVMYGEVRQLGE